MPFVLDEAWIDGFDFQTCFNGSRVIIWEEKKKMGFRFSNTLTLLIFLIKEKDYSRYDYPVAQFA